MDFSKVTEWRIPVNGEMKDVIKVTQTSTGTVLWEGLVPVTFNDNQPCNVIYKLYAFGCTPTLTTRISGQSNIVSQTQLGDNTLVIPTIAGKTATVTISDIDDGYDLYINGNKNTTGTFTYTTANSIIEMYILIIQRTHTFDKVKDRVHDDTFIYSPGSLAGGFKYTLEFYATTDTAQKNKTIYIGHNGNISKHIMHLGFGYQVDNGQVQRLSISYSDGTSKIGYLVGKEFVQAAAAENVTNICATGLSGSQTYVHVKPITIDVSHLNYTNQIRFGIILRDDSASCSGISFGTTNGTICQITNIEAPTI